MTEPRTPREQNFLDDLRPDEYVIAERWLDYEGGTMAVAALAIEIHNMRPPWWRGPTQFLGVFTGGVIAAAASWKGIDR